jgi:leader peptidase (prepilin peptidase)/N-methyltransferase
LECGDLSPLYGTSLKAAINRRTPNSRKEQRLNPFVFLFSDAVPLAFRLSALVVLGAIVGSFLNVCIARLPYEKSLIWPGSRCGQCLQPVRWYDNLPLISYWVLRGRCRTCGAPFSVRYFLVELLTAASFAGLYYLEVVANVHDLRPAVLGPERFATGRVVLFAWHALLFCFLMVATFSDLDTQTIPLPLTVIGTVIGLIGSVIWPWPWPYTPAEAERVLPPGQSWIGGSGPVQGLYAWPVWGPLPQWLQPGGNWQTGLATGLAGVLAGTLMLRAVRFLFGLGAGAAYMEEPEPEHETTGFARRVVSWFGRVGGRALGLGDADLMMLAGAFLGWQPVVVAFFVGVIPGLFFGLAHLVLRGNRPLPYGPALAIGVVITFLAWGRIAPVPVVRSAFFHPPLVIGAVVFGSVGMIVLAFLLRLVLALLSLLRRGENVES